MFTFLIFFFVMFALYKEVSYPLTKQATHTYSDSAQNREINFHGLEENNENDSSQIDVFVDMAERASIHKKRVYGRELKQNFLLLTLRTWYYGRGERCHKSLYKACTLQDLPPREELFTTSKQIEFSGFFYGDAKWWLLESNKVSERRS